MVKMATVLLQENGYIVTSDTNPKAGLKRVLESPPDLLLLDIRMAELDGFEVCKAVRANSGTAHLPIVMISVAAKETDVVLGLELGADDYIRKPYKERELLARVKSVLRRKSPIQEPQEILEKGPLRVNLKTYEVSINKTILQLTPKEFKLLTYFLRKEGQVVTRASISENVWQTAHLPTSRSIDVRVDQLRKKLGEYGVWIHSLRGVGYRFEIED